MKNDNIPAIRFKGFTEAWEQRKVSDILKSVNVDICDMINESGKYEVIQQGNVPIAGYTDSEPYKEYQPIVLFGDHTLSIYKPKSPFLVASDGVKAYYLQNVSGDYFAYLLLRNLPTNEGYKRYSSILKDKEIKLTYDKNEESKIGALLNNLDTIITLHQRKYEKLINIKKSLLEKMFPGDGESIPKIRFRGFTKTWEKRKYKDIFDYERPDKYIVKSDKYEAGNITPVLTANKGFILGYTNETRTYNNPCIIFDDFTLDSKYVDFKFMVKSSAMKILTVKKGNNLYFAFNRLNSSKLESLGHARHYISVVQESDTLIPKLEEQDKLSELFKKIEDLITLHQRKYEKLKNIKKSLLNKMFV